MIIKINFNYHFSIDEKKSINFVYDIVAKLVIASEDGKSSYFEKSYVLQDKEELKMTNNQIFNLNKELNLDYNYYNNLANSFKMSYGIEPTSTLTIYFRILKNNPSNSDDIIYNESSVMTVSIPLSEKAINIKMDYKDIDEVSEVVSQNNDLIKNKYHLIIGIVLIIVAIILMIRAIRLFNLNNPKKTKYDKYISKILREYDRLIVETDTKPDITNNKIIDINKFEELLDVRDNLKLPVKYYVVENHKECYFYINHDKELYLNVVRENIINEKRKI